MRTLSSAALRGTLRQPGSRTKEGRDAAASRPSFAIHDSSPASSSSVTSAAMAERSERVSVTCPNSP